jgi:hypothetical protein
MITDNLIAPLPEQECKLQPVSGISTGVVMAGAELPHALERVSRAVTRLEMELSRFERHLRTAHDQERRVEIQ